MSETQQNQSVPFLFLGNRLWIDFVNTAIVDKGRPIDLIPTFDHLLHWLDASKAMDPEHNHQVNAWFEGEKTAVLEDAHNFRQICRASASKMANRAELDEESIAAINDILHSRRAWTTLTPSSSGSVISEHSEWTENIAILAPIASSLAASITNGESPRIHKCGDEDCVLHFYDTSKNHARRWCSMDLCGNRNKVAAHYDRNHTATKS